MFDKDLYATRRANGQRGQTGIRWRTGMGLIVGPAKIEHSPAGSYLRKVKRPMEVAGRGRRRRSGSL